MDEEKNVDVYDFSWVRGVFEGYYWSLWVSGGLFALTVFRDLVQCVQVEVVSGSFEYFLEGGNAHMMEL